MEPTTGTDIVVGVGDCRIASLPATSISTFALGSCVAIIAYDWKIRIGALLHAMLPDSSIDQSRATLDPFLYVDTGLKEMFRRLEERGGSSRRLKCSVAGGASMIVDPAHFEIGKRNHLAVKKMFWKLGLFLDQEDIGGSESRSVRLNLETGRVDMRKGAGPGKIFVPGTTSLVGSGAPERGNPGKGKSDESIAR